jgi:Tol biopolymer transport system component
VSLRAIAVPVDQRTVRRARVLAGSLIAALGLTTAPALAAFPGANGRIAFQGGDFEIHAMEPDGSATANLTGSAGTEFQPAWSVDGSKVAFGKLGAGSRAEIHVMNADGSAQTPLTSAGTIEASAPAWSPDGRKIAFLSKRNGGDSVFVMNADGSGQKKIA